MKTISESELDVALDKLKSIKMIAESFINSDSVSTRLVMNTILEVIDE